jgi:AbrB family looped-hinge helix DNA binding protein
MYALPKSDTIKISLYKPWIDMTTVTLSSKFQVVVPREVRERMNLKPGQKLSMLAYNGHIRLAPILPPGAYRGIFKGIDTSIPEEPDRTFD